jgi:hypothetical protein
MPNSAHFVISGRQGREYLILPPGHHGAAPDGYIALPSANYQGYALLRSILRSGRMPRRLLSLQLDHCL